MRMITGANAIHARDAKRRVFERHIRVMNEKIRQSQAHADFLREQLSEHGVMYSRHTNPTVRH